MAACRVPREYIKLVCKECHQVLTYRPHAHFTLKISKPIQVDPKKHQKHFEPGELITGESIHS